MDTQYQHEHTTTQYIIIDTQTDNSYIYIYTCVLMWHTYQKVSLPSVKVCVNVRNPWYITESLSLDIKKEEDKTAWTLWQSTVKVLHLGVY